VSGKPTGREEKEQARAEPLVILENEQVSLWYHPEAKIVHHKIHRFLDRGMFQNLLETGVECLERQGAHKWLSDDENSVVVSPEDLAWSRTVWRPRAVGAGLRYWAVVTPTSSVGSLQMKSLIAEYRALGVTVRAHASLIDALTWLDSVDTDPTGARS